MSKTNSKNTINLRWYQRVLLNKLHDTLPQVPNILAVMGTGLGKTILAVKFHEEYLPGEKTMFIVDQQELAWQAKARFNSVDPTIKVGVEMNKHRADPDCDVFIVSADTLGRTKSTRIIRRFAELRNRVRKVIVDEAHKSVVPKFIRVLEYMGVGRDNYVDGKVLLGLTATAHREDGVGLGYLYSDAIENYDLRFGISDGWLTEYEWIQVHTDTDISHLKKQTSGYNKGEFKTGEVEAAVNNLKRNMEILKAYKEHAYGMRTLAYCASVDHAYELQTIFENEAIPCCVIEANTPSEQRQRYYEQFENGDLWVMFNYGVLTTGFDSTEAQVLMMLRPIGSRVLYTQIIGRGARPSESAFIDYSRNKQQRLDFIAASTKPVCKLIDMVDVYKKDGLINMASLHGLNPNLKTDKDQKFFKEVLEPIEQFEQETAADVREIVDMEQIHLRSTTRRVRFSSLSTPPKVKQFSPYKWLAKSAGSYELIISDIDKVLQIRQNLADLWEVFEIDTRSGMPRLLGKYNSQAGAFRNADEYVNQFDFNDKFVKHNEWWNKKPITEKQYAKLSQYIDWFEDLHIDGEQTDPNTGLPVIRDLKNNTKLDRGTATAALQQLFTLLKMQRNGPSDQRVKTSASA